MNTYLLYQEKDWVNTVPYYDSSSIVQDLSLHILFRMASRDVIREGEAVKQVTESDPFIQETMRKVMLVPLESSEEIYFRQSVLKDCINNEDFVRDLYKTVTEILKNWEVLGRKEHKRNRNANTVNGLVTLVHVLNLFVKGLSDIKRLLHMNSGRLHSKGFEGLLARLDREYSEEIEDRYQTILSNISFFVEKHTESNIPRATVMRPRIVMECGIAEGLKLGDIKLEDVCAQEKRYRDPNSALSKVQGFINSKTTGGIPLQKETPMYNQVADIEFEAVRYIMACCDPIFTTFGNFFDQLRLQIAYYVGALNLLHHFERFDLDHCFPVVGKQDELYFEELKEFVMCMEQRVRAVGNTCNIQDKMLLVVTGANQGGKSTFLRSIGIAQVMMQCGLPVAAYRYRSGIFPAFFTHFTRREDSAMNSGRLDEELGRMNRIVENLGERSLILLNESFATTTEKEGSVIAYDIIKALSEAGVKILTVTHLLSFAQRIYEETQAKEAAGEESGVEFLSAERMENGKRTFKMIQHAPELTSFGLDLYESIIKESKEN